MHPFLWATVLHVGFQPQTPLINSHFVSFARAFAISHPDDPGPHWWHGRLLNSSRACRDLLESYQEATVVYFIQSLIIVSYVVLTVFVIVDVFGVYRHNIVSAWSSVKSKMSLIKLGGHKVDPEESSYSKARVKFQGVWMAPERVLILQQAKPFAHPLFLGRLASFLHDADEDGVVRAALAVETILVMVHCVAGFERMHGQRPEATTDLDCPCGAKHESNAVEMESETRWKYLSHRHWVSSRPVDTSNTESTANDAKPELRNMRYHFNVMTEVFEEVEFWLHHQMSKWTLLDCLKADFRDQIGTSFMFAASDDERRAHVELDELCAEVMRSYEAPRIVRWFRAKMRALFKRRRVWPSNPESTPSVYASDSPYQASPAVSPRPARDVEALRARTKDKDGGGEFPHARKAFADLVVDEMKYKLGHYAAIRTDSEGHRALLEFFGDLGRAYEEDASPENDPRWLRQISSLRATARTMSKLGAGGGGAGSSGRPASSSRSAASSLSKMLSVLLMFTFAAGQGLPCVCPAASSQEEMTATCENMLVGGSADPSTEELCRSDVRTRDTHCATQEDTRLGRISRKQP